jgi:phospholipid/cholesterol/gamma-HCH transport system substrate-binding protein
MAIISFGKVGELFSPRVVLEAFFADVKGLKKGAPVWLSGVEVGNVKDIILPMDGQGKIIRVIMEVDADLRPLLKTDSTAMIRTLGLLGDKYVELSPGSTSAEVLPQDTAIQGIIPSDFKELVSGGSETLEEITQFLQNLNGLITKLSDGNGTAAHLVNDPTLYKAVREFTEVARDLLKKVQQGEGTVGKLLEDPELYQRLSISVASLESFSKKLDQQDTTLNKLVSEPALYNHLDSASERLDRLLAQVEQGRGVAGQLLQDEELSQELKALIVDLRFLVGDMKKHPKKYFSFKLF